MDHLTIIDSNVFIFAEIKTAEEHQMSIKKIKDACDSGSFAINAIIVSELFHKLSKLLDPKEAYSKVRGILENPFAQWLDMSSEMAATALNLSLKNHIKINDALIAQQGLEFGIPVLTDDSDFKKIKGLAVVWLR